jgi:hypothetical protein
VVLTIQAVEGTGMVKYGQIVMAMFSPFGDSIRGVTTACAARTNKISHAVGGKGVVVIRKVALVRAATFYGAAFHSTKPAEAHAAFRDSALVHTKLAADAGLCPRRFFRKTIRLPATIVNQLDFRPHFLKMRPDTIYAKAYYSRNGKAAFAAMTARAQVISKYSFVNASHDFLKKISGVRKETQQLTPET